MDRRRSTGLRLLLLATATGLVLPGGARAQSIMTIAGGGTDDGRPATAAVVANPGGVATDGAGNLYIAETFKARVRRVDPKTGAISTYAGTGIAGYSGDGGPAAKAQLSHPSGLAVDSAGNLYIADVYNGVIRRVEASTGVITTVTDSPNNSGIVVDGSTLFLSEYSIVKMVRLATGTTTVLAGTTAGPCSAQHTGDGGPATLAKVWPSGIALDARGNLFLVERAELDSACHYTASTGYVRRIAAGTGIITTIAGNPTGTFPGDGLPATAARLALPSAIAVDRAGNVLVGEQGGCRVRVVSAVDGRLSTLAGTGACGYSGDGGPATGALLGQPNALSVNDAGDVLIADSGNRVRVVDAATGTIRTVAGNGEASLLGDGGPATAAQLASPHFTAVDASGNLFIADTENNRIRRVDARTGTIRTVAGNGSQEASGDGGPATAAGLGKPIAVAVDARGALFVADFWGNSVRRVDPVTGTISRVVGDGTYGAGGDGGPATAAQLQYPHDVAVDDEGNLYVADSSLRVRKVTAGDGIIRTVAGGAGEGFSGDGGPATAAKLELPVRIALDAERNLYLAVGVDGNPRVRKVSATTGTITTFAGNGSRESSGDGGPATQAGMRPTDVDTDRAGNVYVTDLNDRVRRIDTNGIISSVVGPKGMHLTGDGGPATEAGLQYPCMGVTVDARGHLYVTDMTNGRIRAVYSCTSVEDVPLAAPANGTTTASTGAALSWRAVAGAFRYDLHLDTTYPAARVLAADLATSTPTPFTIPPETTYTYSVSNLSPGTTHYWKVLSRGDPFCPVVSTASSQVRLFTTAGGCAAPGSFSPSSPAAGATGVAPTAVLTWLAASGAGTYDVFLGSSNPPPLAARGLTGTSFPASGLTPGATYFWSVAAHASCDAAKTTGTPVRSFVVAGGCTAPGAFVPQSPANGAAGIAPDPTLAWSAAPGATSYDVYLGTSTNPPLHFADVPGKSLGLSGLAPAATYFWKVVAKTSCNAGQTSTFPIQSFSVSGACNAPAAPAIAFVPPGGVAVGQTYVVAWSDAPGLGPGGGYVVERSASASFSPLLDSQTTTGTAASFTSPSEGTVHHRVRALPACNPGKAGPWSASRPVAVVTGTPDVVFTVQPTAVVTALGERIDGNKTTSFTLENIGRTTLTLQLTQQFLGPTAFFTIVDPLGGSVNGFTLDPRKPKTFEVRFQGADPDVSGSYQGVVVVLQASFQPLAIAPFAFVNLKVGGGETATPAFEAGGAPTGYVYFPGTTGEPSARILSVDVVNAGSSPMDLAAEIGPELWLVPRAGWNSVPIPPHGKRSVTFTTDRSRAPNGSALPRYTYFTVRTKDGRTARLLVQDDDEALLGRGRPSQLGPGVRSYVVPSVVKATSKIQNTFVTTLRLSNAGSDPVQADLFYTPRDSDGYSTDVRRATVVVPPNDVVTLTDPLVQLYGLAPPASGQLEVRAAPEKIGALTVTSSVDAPARTGGTFGFRMPTAGRGEGARAGRPHAISGITFTPAYRTNLILAETTGVDCAVVRATLWDQDGIRKGDVLLDVPRYGQRQVAVTDLGAPSGLEAGQIELAVESGGGAVVGLVTVIDNTNDDAVTYFGRPVADSSGALQAQGLLARLAPRPAWAKAAGTMKLVVPAVVNGYSTFRGSSLPYTFQSLMGFSSLSKSPATFRLTYRDLDSGASISRTVTVPARSTRAFKNVLEELFGIPRGRKSQGPVFVEADPNGTMYCKVFSILQSGSLGDGFPVVPVPAESLTGDGSAKPIFVDGLEQSVDYRRGTRSNLILNEVTGLSPATVLVRLYEPGNRSTPIAEREVTLAAGEKTQLSTVFTGLGLESAERNKDRANVLCVVTAKSGSGLVSAVVTTIDNATGDTKNLLLTPTGGTSASGGGTIDF